MESRLSSASISFDPVAFILDLGPKGKKKMGVPSDYLSLKLM